MKTVHIYDQPRKKPRSPLLDEFYDYLCSHSSDLVTFSRCRNRIVPPYPNAVYTGFNPGTFINDNIDVIRSNHIKVIIESMDNWSFGKQENVLGSSKSTVDVVVCRTTYKIENVTDAINKQARFRNAEYILSPWSSNPALYKPLPWADRDIDFFMCCTPYGQRSESQKMVVHTAKIARKSCLVGYVFGKVYRELLSRSKVFVITNCYNTMVQKFVEGALSGCCLMCEIPPEGRNLLSNNGTCIEITPLPQSVQKTMLRFSTSDKIEAISKAGTHAFTRSRNLTIEGPKFVNSLYKALFQ